MKLGRLTMIMIGATLVTASLSLFFKNPFAKIKNGKKEKVSVTDNSDNQVILRCNDGYNLLVGSENAVLIVPAGNCWTEWQIRDTRFRYLRVDPEKEIWIQNSFTDGTVGEPHLDKPKRESEIRKTVSAFRFKNESTAPIKVIVTQK